MGFKIKNTKEKVPSTYKYIYIKEDLVKKIDCIAKENNTSFNNIVISMIEACLEDYSQDEKNRSYTYLWYDSLFIIL